MSAVETIDDETPVQTEPSKGAWWMLGVLSFVSVIDWADRALISILPEPLKDEFGFTDGQIGLLMGVAFGLLFILFGIPIGRMADRRNRRNIVAIAMGFWSLMTVAFGLAQNFIQLVVARVAIGAGMAGCTAPSISMLTDVFPFHRRAMAMAIYNAGGIIGFSLGVWLGSIIAERYGWRLAMIYFGIFGLIVALLIFAAVREPERLSSSGQALAKTDALPVREVLRFMLNRPSLVHLTIATGLLLGVDNATSSWTVTFFIRSHDMGLAESGQIVSAIWVVSGIGGVVLGGYLMDKLARTDVRWHVWTGAASAVAAVLLAFPLYLSDSAIVAMISLFAVTFAFSMWYAATFTVIMSLLGNRMRGMGLGIINVFRYAMFAVTPTVTGYVSDAFSSVFGEESLRYAVFSTYLLAVWAVLHLMLAGKTLKRDYELNPDDSDAVMP